MAQFDAAGCPKRKDRRKECKQTDSPRMSRLTSSWSMQASKLRITPRFGQLCRPKLSPSSTWGQQQANPCPRQRGPLTQVERRHRCGPTSHSSGSGRLGAATAMRSGSNSNVQAIHNPPGSTQRPTTSAYSSTVVSSLSCQGFYHQKHWVTFNHTLLSCWCEICLWTTIMLGPQTGVSTHSKASSPTASRSNPLQV